jgi:zinc protease
MRNERARERPSGSTRELFASSPRAIAGIAFGALTIDQGRRHAWYRDESQAALGSATRTRDHECEHPAREHRPRARRGRGKPASRLPAPRVRPVAESAAASGRVWLAFERLRADWRVSGGAAIVFALFRPETFPRNPMKLVLSTVASVFALTACHLDFASTSARSERAAVGTTSATAGRAFPYDVQRFALENGLEVRLIPMPSEGLAAYWTIVRTGSRDEVEPGVTGFAHFFEHIMFHGTEKFPSYDKVVVGMGADFNASTTDDWTQYYLSVTRDDLPKVIEVEADRFQHLTYGEPEFKTEAGAVYGEYRKGHTSPFEVMFEAVQNAAFDRHTYKHTTIGFEADIKAMPQQYAYSKSFFQRFYRPENCVVIVAGDFDAKTIEAEIRKNYSGWKRGYQAPKVEPEPEQTAQRRIDVPFDGELDPILTIHFKGERLIPDDRTMIAATLLGDLAFGETTAIYKKLVLDEQRLDMLGANFGYQRDPGLWSVFARVKDASDVDAIEREIWAAIDALAEHGVTQAALDAVRSRAKYGFLSNLTTPASVCESIAQIVAITGDLTAIDQTFATLDRVTPADVQRAAQKWLKRERSTVALVHSAKQAAASAPVALAEPPVLMPIAQDPNVAFKLWFKVGSQDDPAGKEGLAQLVGDLLSEGGTRSQSYDKILEELFPIAAGYGASVDKEMTVISGEVHRDNVERFYSILSQVLTEPGFREDDFKRIKDSMISSIETQLRFSSDEELGKAALYNAVFAGTPYGHIDSGTVESLKAITLDDVRAFWKQHYTAENVVVGLGGSYSPELLERVTRDLAKLGAGKPEVVPAPQAKTIEGRKVLIVEKPGASTAISFGVPIDVRRGSREYYALWIANSWLGEHRNSASHLYQVIRDARGMNYGDYSYIEVFPNGGRRSMPPTGVGRRQHLFEVWVRPVPNEQAIFALRAALREVDKLAKNGLTKEQFEYTKKFLKNYSLHFAETTAERLGYALDDRYYGVDGHLAKFRRMMDEITLDEVNAAIKRSMQADRLQIAMVAPNAEALKAALVSDAPSGIDYHGIPKPDEVLAEDKEIERFPLKLRTEDVMIVPVEQMFESSGAKP